MGVRITDLPEDPLVQILEWLDIKSRAIAELVCKQWKSLIEERLQPINFKLIVDHGEDSIEYHCQDPGHKIKETIRLDTVEKAMGLLRKNNRATAIAIEATNASDLSTCLNVVSSTFWNLEHLELKYSFGSLSSGPLASLGLNSLSRLKHLSVCESSNVCKMYPPGGAMRPEPIDTRSIKQLFESCSQLESLFLNCSCILDLKELTILPPKLKSMLMPAIYVSLKDLNVFVAGDGKQLEEIQLIAGENGHLRTICGAMNGLRTLIIPSLTIDSANDIRLLKNLRYLETLKIGLSGIDVNDAMLEVLEHCPRLQQLDLTLCYIRDKVLTQVPRLCPTMKEVCVYNYNVDTPSGITDKTLEALSTLKGLQKLCIPSAEFTATGLVELLKHCPTIHYLFVEKVAGDIGLVVAEMIRKATEDPKTKYEMICSYEFDVSSVQKPANLRINYQ